MASLRALLTLVLSDAGATRGAVFVPRDQQLALAAQCDLDQAGLDLARTAWNSRRDELDAGRVVRFGRSALWPLLRGTELVAVVYLDGVREGFPDEPGRQDGSRLALCVAGARTRTAGSYLEGAASRQVGQAGAWAPGSAPQALAARGGRQRWARPQVRCRAPRALPAATGR